MSSVSQQGFVCVVLGGILRTFSKPLIPAVTPESMCIYVCEDGGPALLSSIFTCDDIMDG
jgi:hypothetical protein